MNEIDKKNNVPKQTVHARGAVLAKFVANFSGRVSLNDVADSGKAAMAQVSAGMDSKSIHTALAIGHSATRLTGSFFEMIPLDGQVENVIIQRTPETVIHIAERKSGLLEDASRPSVLDSEPEDSVLGTPSRVFDVNVISTKEMPGPDIEHWFNPEKKLRQAA
jgi:hypothetical protein